MGFLGSTSTVTRARAEGPCTPRSGLESQREGHHDREPKIAVQMGAGGSLALNGTTTLYGQLLATSITTGRTVTITHRPLLTAGVSVG